MAIPPIISNLPFLKLFRTEQSGAENATQQTNASNQADVVELSAEALQKAEETNVTDTEIQEARETASETRTLLENGEETLGLDPAFA